MKRILFLIFFALAGAVSAAVSAVSSNAISLDTSDRSSVTVASERALPLFSSTKPLTVIIIR